MCGIIAAFNKNTKKKKAEKVNDYIVNQFEDQHSRGQRGFGIIRIDPKGKIEIDRACETTKFLIDLYMKPSTMMIAHHRTPTSTENWLDQTHPIVVSNKLLEHDYCVIHNGIISNDKELHDKHIAKGFVYTTEYTEEGYYANAPTRIKYNDSEAIAIEVALFIEKQIEAIAIDNSAAFIALQINKKTGIVEKVFFGRNGIASDLKMSKSKGKIRIASEGTDEDVKVNTLFSFNIKDPKMHLTEENMPFIFTRTKPIDLIKEINKDINDKKLPKNVENSKLPLIIETKKEEIPVKTTRSWVTITEDTEYEDVPVFDKNYEELMKAEFKERIKENESTDISATIDDALDEEVTKITELVESYKGILVTDKLEQNEQSYFVGRIAKIMKTMRSLTDIEEEDYKEKLAIEEQKEIEEYNVGFDPTYATGYIPNTCKTEDELEKEWEKRRQNYHNREY